MDKPIHGRFHSRHQKRGRQIVAQARRETVLMAVVLVLFVCARLVARPKRSRSRRTTSRPARLRTPATEETL
ncbi:MAG: hypothetical protein HYV04_00430 [Deltaproteobacteria bacterium]|nr:hypothetical protein [Deltaproteobacteria bacterium]